MAASAALVIVSEMRDSLRASERSLLVLAPELIGGAIVIVVCDGRPAAMPDEFSGVKVTLSASGALAAMELELAPPPRKLFSMLVMPPPRFNPKLLKSSFILDDCMLCECAEISLRARLDL